jgi:dihydroorotate dehydrogenase (NAD+) catalytic subunit
MRKVDLKIGRLHLKNPVLTASGTFGYGIEYEGLVPIEMLGGIVTKSITLKPKEGNRSPRIVETDCGIINSVGLSNIGVEAFIKEVFPKIAKYRTPIIVSIAGERADEYREVAKILDKEEIAGIEVNISCPNVESGGAVFGRDTRLTHNVVEGVRCATNLTVIAKLPPADNICEIAKSAESAGADALSLINTIRAMAIDIETQRPILGNIFGGLSGPAIKPIALYMVWKVADIVSIPIIGIGGIRDAEDAVEFLLAGASCVQVGTENIREPSSVVKIADGIREYMERKGVSDITELIGRAKLNKRRDGWEGREKLYPSLLI